MKSAVEQLATYKSVHLNASNIITHFVGVPLIVWAAFLFFSFIRIPIGDIVVSGALVAAVLVSIYYVMLRLSLAIGLALFLVPVLLTTEMVSHQAYAVWYGVVVFVIGWVFQLIGHKYEKAKPAFIDDMNQLLIGPFFLMAELYFLFGWEQELNKQITPIAVTKRRALESTRKTLAEPH